MTDTVEKFEITRLRTELDRLDRDYSTVRDAHDYWVLESDRLRVENERLRAALEKICNGPRDADLDYVDLFVEVKIEARAALEKKR